MESTEPNDDGKGRSMKSNRNFTTVVKKAHAVKNVVIGGINTRKINYLSQIYEGKRHDKKIVDDENPALPKEVSLYKDTGFQGYEPADITTFQPQKKPKGKELTAEQKEQNTLISKIRIVIEHIINGVKRCRIVKDLFRNTQGEV
jgi:DDE superfamily endonuclease